MIGILDNSEGRSVVNDDNKKNCVYHRSVPKKPGPTTPPPKTPVSRTTRTTRSSAKASDEGPRRRAPKAPSESGEAASRESSGRRRRTPEEARQLILTAAQTLIAESGPDAIGLKDVARAAGVSHGLVSHYFGTYEGLVEEALVDHLQRQRLEGLERMQSTPSRPELWLELAFEQLSHPLTVRLLVWALLTGRLEREDFVVFRTRGLAATVDVLESYLAATGAPHPDRDTLERAVLIGICTVIGYTLGRKPLWGSLGKRASAQKDLELRAQLASTLLSALPRSS